MGSTVTVLGEVHRQNYVGYHEGLTLINALSFCMGLMETHADHVKYSKWQKDLIATVTIPAKFFRAKSGFST